MSRRIELELTSARDDGSWTWRAAGALQPRGELDGSLLPSGAKVGDVLRAEADFTVDGITVVSVLPPKSARVEPERIELRPAEREFQPVVTTLAARTERRGRPDRGPRDGDRPDRARRDRPRTDGPRPDGGRPDGPRPDRNRDDRSRPGGDRPDRPPRTAGSGADRPARPPRRERPAPPPPKPKAKKLRPGRANRDALLATLPPEQHPIAEQLFRGGIPAVRAAISEQNANAKAEGLPEIPAATVLALAENLAPAVRLADWLDRATAALADADVIALKDLRAVVHAADDVVREDATRPLVVQLRATLDRRSASEQQEWIDDITQSLADGRVVRALRLASRSPQPNESLPAELATQLAEAAGAALTADAAPDRWATVLDAIAYSPVRRSVTPLGAPAEPGEELLAAVRKHATRVPKVAAMFGIETPSRPAPRPKTPPRRAAEVQAEAGLLPPPPGATRRIPPPPAPTPSSTVAEPAAVEPAATQERPAPAEPEPSAAMTASSAAAVDETTTPASPDADVEHQAPPLAAGTETAAEAKTVPTDASPEAVADAMPVADVPTGRSTGTDAPTVAEAPAVDAPAAEDVSTVADASSAEAAPVVEDVSPLEASPMVSDASSVEGAPSVEAAPSVDNAPTVAEAAPSVDDAPTVEASPTAVDAPRAEEAATPVVVDEAVAEAAETPTDEVDETGVEELSSSGD
jgi:hypothetical protein